jgi:hypothetical protein
MYVQACHIKDRDKEKLLIEFQILFACKAAQFNAPLKKVLCKFHTNVSTSGMSLYMAN